MIIDSPMTAPPGAPINRPLSNDRLGGGTTAVPAESARPLNDPEEGNESRRNEEQANTENRPGRNDAELAARARLDTARERADEDNTVQSPVRERADTSDQFLSREEIGQLRERLEARLETQPPPGATLRSVDETI
jgi:hypothetical protein